MTTINNVIKLDKTNTQGAAVLLEDGLYDESLVGNFSPTHSSVEVLNKLSQAVLPAASKDQRAMNWYGSYGSGKSHLGTLIGQLLRDGAHTEVFLTFLRKLENFGEDKLADRIKKSFLDPSDPDSRPYLIVPLYASQTPSLAAKLLEGLYKSIERTAKSNSDIDLKKILPRTEYDAAIDRFNEIIDSNPDYVNCELSKWTMDENYYNTEELQVGLDRHEPTALDDFSLWHQKVCHGAIFQPQVTGGRGFVEAYQEAANNLTKIGYGGIVVLWDEFGNALEDLIRTPQRNPIDEIIELQRFVENVCQPSSGHVIFIGMTHVSMAEYGVRSESGQDIQDRLKTIEGRFTSIRIELKASESEGYHLLGVQTSWSKYGNELYENSVDILNECCSVWKTLPLFHTMATELPFIAKSCYPLHPITAAALFAISTRYAQATRTAFTFLRDLDQQIWDKELHDLKLFNGELVRLPLLVDYYEESLGKNAILELDKYQRAVAEIHASGADSNDKIDILKILFLSVLLAENFQATDNFLSIALHDCLPDKASSLFEELAWLKKAGLIWKNDMTGLWTLAGEAGVDPEPLIKETLLSLPMTNVEDMFITYPFLTEDLLPILGNHNIEPSNHGVIRSYSVEMVTAPFEPSKISISDLKYSAKVVLVFSQNAQTSEDIRTDCRRTPLTNKLPIYYWISDLSSETLLKGLRRYLAIYELLKQKSHGEGLRKQLQAKWERNRHDLLNILSERYGREGLETGKTKIVLSGQEDPISCNSWHEFIENLSNYVYSLYPSEIDIRSARLNEMADEYYNGKKVISDIIDRILNFDNNIAYQDDLLGYAETKQQAAIIDGILGEYSNNIFIHREKGWDLKSIDEIEGNIKQILKFIKTELIRKRDNPYRISELRKKLLGTPYGLPSSVHAIFTAIALRHDIHRIEVVGDSQRTFGKVLGKAFTENNLLRIRVQDFNRKQKMILDLLSTATNLNTVKSQSKIDNYKRTVSKLREKILGYPDNILYSSQLSQEARNLVIVISAIGKSTHDIANELIKLTPFNKEWKDKQEDSPYFDTISAIEDMLNEFDKLANERIFALKEVMKELVPEGEQDLQKLVNDLKSYNTKEASQVAELLDVQNDLTDEALKKIVRLFTNKDYDECTDIEIGQLTGKLRSLFDHVKIPTIRLVPPPTIKVNENPTKPYDPGLIEESNEVRINNIVFNLQQVLDRCKQSYGKEIVNQAVIRFYKKFHS